MTPSAAAAALLLLTSATANAHAQPRTRGDCEAAFPASTGRPGKDVVWVPTSDDVVRAMLTTAQVTSRDRVLDLGAGDGKIAIAAAKAPFGARAVGIEYDSGMARRAACMVRVEGLTDKVRIVEGDIFKEDFGDATVVTLYLLPRLNVCVRHRILAMEPGTRVVSNQFDMADWEPEMTLEIEGRNVHRWTVPARVDGVWDFHDGQGRPFTLELRQTFATLSGEIIEGGILLSATLRGPELRFTFDAGGMVNRFSGTVRGRDITGVLLRGTDAHTVVGRLRGALRAAPWAKMPSECAQYYAR
jgi:hypothetical protein